ncbi:MAG: hypothetical protein ACK4FW_08615, partial [Stenotrophomonas sp.]
MTTCGSVQLASISSRRPPRQPLPVFGKLCATALLLGACATVFAPVLPPRWAAAVTVGAGLLLWCWPGRWRGLGAAVFGLGWATLHAHLALAAQLPADAAKNEYLLRGRVIDLPTHGAIATRFVFR